MSHRVVILSPQGRSLCPSLGMMLPGVECEFVESGYEAAAELFCLDGDETRALIIDFQALQDRHLPLLDIARRQDVELMGVGAFPAGLSSEHLSGMRLLGVKDLPKAIESLGLTTGNNAETGANSDEDSDEENDETNSDSNRTRLTAKGQDTQFEPDTEPASQPQEGEVLS